MMAIPGQRSEPVLLKQFSPEIGELGVPNFLGVASDVKGVVAVLSGKIELRDAMTDRDREVFIISQPSFVLLMYRMSCSPKNLIICLGIHFYPLIL